MATKIAVADEVDRSRCSGCGAMTHDEWCAALHESQHAVVAQAEGFRVLDMNIVPRDDLQGETSIEVPQDWVQVDDDLWVPVNQHDPLQLANASGWLRNWLAPIAGQVIFGADPLVGHDKERTDQFLAKLHLVNEEAYVRQLLVGARQLVEIHRPAIVALAAVLVARRQLSGYEVRRVIDTVDVIATRRAALQVATGQ